MLTRNQSPRLRCTGGEPECPLPPARARWNSTSLFLAPSPSGPFLSLHGKIDLGHCQIEGEPPLLVERHHHTIDARPPERDPPQALRALGSTPRRQLFGCCVATQMLTELFKNEGYDGVGYNSHFNGGYSVALFDISAAKIRSCAPYEVKQIQVEIDKVGNDWYRE